MQLPACVRLIATDLDGTLLRSDKTVGARTVRAFRAAADRGIHLVVATGRQAYRPPVDLADLAVGHLIGANGALCLDLGSGRPLFEHLLSPDAATAVAGYLKSRLPDVRISAARNNGAGYTGEPGYTDLMRPGEKMPSWWTIETASLAEVVGEPTLKLTARHPTLDAEAMHAVLAESGLDGFHATTSGAPFLEVSADGVTKAASLAELCALLDVPQDGVIAFGDARNDVEMLTWAGMGVAMGNASEDTQAAADHVTADNDHDGLAEVIEAVLARPRATRPGDRRAPGAGK